MDTTNVSASKYGLVSNIVRCENKQYQSWEYDNNVIKLISAREINRFNGNNKYK